MLALRWVFTPLRFLEPDCNMSGQGARTEGHPVPIRTLRVRNRSFLAVVLVLGAFTAGSAVAARRTVSEKDANLDIAMRVRSHLEDSGMTVVMTRTVDVARSPSERVQVAGRHHSDAFVSLHNNSSSMRSHTHSEVYHQQHLRQSTTLAESISTALESALGNPSRVKSRRGERGDYYWQLRMNRIPAVIVESAFVSNPDQARMLGTSPEFREQIATAVAGGIAEYQRGLGKPAPFLDPGMPVRVPDQGLPGPTSATATTDGRYTVSLSWQGDSLAPNYRVYRNGRLSAEIANPFASTGNFAGRSASRLSFVDTWASPGQTYDYAIVATRHIAAATLESAPSHVTAKTPGIVVCLDPGHGGIDSGAVGHW
ncbi:MAG: hypothetical protein NVSMB57_10890 [Actinomycetota bacterium]